MIERNDELIYVKRNYFFPFKPFLDYEYKRFGYKKCDVKKTGGGITNTVYYVKHRERPTGLCDTLYSLNLPLSYFRTNVVPVLLAIFVASILIEGTLGANLLIDKQLVLLVLSAITMLASTFLANMGYNAYKQNDTDGKTDRALKSRGWTPWTSYKDNDPRFDPPVPKNAEANARSATSSAAARSSSGNTSKPTAPKSNGAENKDGIVTLLSAKGEEIDFEEIAGIAYRGNFYAILQPVELLDGMDDDEALVFKVLRNSDGSNSFEIELDDAIIDAVFEEYNRLYEEAHQK